MDFPDSIPMHSISILFTFDSFGSYMLCLNTISAFSNSVVDHCMFSLFIVFWPRYLFSCCMYYVMCICCSGLGRGLLYCWGLGLSLSD